MSLSWIVVDRKGTTLDVLVAGANEIFCPFIVIFYPFITMKELIAASLKMLHLGGCSSPHACGWQLIKPRTSQDVK